MHLFLEEGLTQRRQIPQSFAVQLMQLGLPQTRALLKNIINNLFTALVEACDRKFFRMGNQLTGGRRGGGEGVTVSVLNFIRSLIFTIKSALSPFTGQFFRGRHLAFVLF
jgi:hypothetical protein